MNNKILISFLLTFQSGIVAAKESEELIIAKNQIIQLKAQVEIMSAYHGDILSTVYWALGVICTVGVFLIGFNWFSNFRVYERDKISLKSELKAIIDSHIEQINSDSKIRINNINTSIKSSVDEVISVPLASLENKLGSVREDMNKNNFIIKRDLWKMERDNWNNKKVFTNSLRVSVDILKLSISMDSSWGVSSALDGIFEDMQNILSSTNGVNLNADDIRDLIHTLNKVEQSHRVTVQSIEKIISEINNKA